MSGLNIANITRMAKEADLWGDIYAIQRFANLVAAAEREACAKLVEQWGDPMGASLQIRARGNNAT